MENTFSEFQAPFIAPAEFNLEMLKEIHLSGDPVAAAAKYGLIYEQIKDLPHFKTRMDEVEQALLIDGTLTPVIAGFGLHAAVEKLAYRVQDDRIPTGDLVKAIDAFKRVKDGAKSNENQLAGTGVSLVINIPAIGGAAPRTIEVTSEPSEKLKEHNTIEAELVQIEEHTKPTTSKAADFIIEVNE